MPVQMHERQNKSHETHLLKKSVNTMLLPSTSLISTASTIDELADLTNRIKSPFAWCSRFRYIKTTDDVFKLPSSGKNAKQVVVMYKFPGMPMDALRPVPPPYALSCSTVTWQQIQIEKNANSENCVGSLRLLGARSGKCLSTESDLADPACGAVYQAEQPRRSTPQYARLHRKKYYSGRNTCYSGPRT